MMGCRANPIGCAELDKTGVPKQVHVNMGASQIHALHRDLDGLELREQVLDGSVVFLCDSLPSLRKRIEASGELFRESCFRVLADKGDELAISDIYGNVVYIREAECAEKLCTLSKLPGGSSNIVGFEEVNINVRPGSTRGLEHFYKDTLGCEVQVDGKIVEVLSDSSVGFTQKLRFFETSEAQSPNAYDTNDRAGYHIAIYLTEFEEAFRSVEAERGIWVNPRYISVDNVTTWDEAKSCGQFRVKDIIDPITNNLVLMLEHEVRCVTREDYSVRSTKEKLAS